jgi:hypothetical protein
MKYSTDIEEMFPKDTSIGVKCAHAPKMILSPEKVNKAPSICSMKRYQKIDTRRKRPNGLSNHICSVWATTEGIQKNIQFWILFSRITEAAPSKLLVYCSNVLINYSTHVVGVIMSSGLPRINIRQNSGLPNRTIFLLLTVYSSLEII